MAPVADLGGVVGFGRARGRQGGAGPAGGKDRGGGEDRERA
ncbi:hypothetical protein ACFWFF_12315 [Streptomyces sp. NPDC060223]